MYVWVCVRGAYVRIHSLPTYCTNAYMCLCLHAYAGHAYMPVTEEVTWWAPASATSCKRLYEAQIDKALSVY